MNHISFRCVGILTLLVLISHFFLWQACENAKTRAKGRDMQIITRAKECSGRFKMPIVSSFPSTRATHFIW